MAVLLNGEDMERLLEEVRPEGETYRGKTWGTILAGTAAVLALGALSNVSCYVGVTDDSLVLAVMDTFDISHLHGRLCLPFSQMEKVKIKRGLVPSQRIIKLKSGDTKLKLSLVNNPLTARIEGQKENIRIICEALEKL